MQSETQSQPDNEVPSTSPPPTAETTQSETHSPSNEEIPLHWIFGEGKCALPQKHFCWWPPLHFFHHLISVISWGHGSLVQVWEVCRHRCSHKVREACDLSCSQEVWERERELVGGRLEHINIVVRFQQNLDQCFIDFDCDFWPRLVCSLLRRFQYAPQSPLIPRCYHIRTQLPIASSWCLSPFPSLACS